MAELVDAHGSGPCAAMCGGSSPLLGTRRCFCKLVYKPSSPYDTWVWRLFCGFNFATILAFNAICVTLITHFSRINYAAITNMASYRTMGKKWRVEVFKHNVRLSHVFATKAEAAAWAAQAEVDIISAKRDDIADKSIGDLLTRVRCGSVYFQMWGALGTNMHQIVFA